MGVEDPAMDKNGFEPLILGFACNWCTFAGADFAGTSRDQYPPNFRMIRVMCSGRVDPTFVLNAFSRGADGVLIAGCHPGDCHYLEGNYQAQRRIYLLKRMIEEFGIEPERLRLEWLSRSEDGGIPEIVADFTRTLKELGPLVKEADRVAVGERR